MPMYYDPETGLPTRASYEIEGFVEVASELARLERDLDNQRHAAEDAVEDARIARGLLAEAIRERDEARQVARVLTEWHLHWLRVDREQYKSALAAVESWGK